MPDLKLDAFFNKMKSTEELRQAGFKLMEKRADASALFSYAMAHGLFDIGTFLPPQEGSTPGSYWTPSHPGLDYLLVATNQAVRNGDQETVVAIVNLVKTVSRTVPPSRTQLDNMYVWSTFVEVAGVLPERFYDDELISLTRIWLTSQFDHGYVANRIGTILLPKILAFSDNTRDKWVCEILTNLTEIDWSQSRAAGRDMSGVVEAYWLKETLEKYATSIGQTAGQAAAETLVSRLREIRTVHTKPSHWYRSAIEDHPQNLRAADYEDIVIAAFRDIAISWLKSSPPSMHSFVESLAKDEFSLLGRIAIHIACELPGKFDDAIAGEMARYLDDPEFHHEIYRYLVTQFSNLDEIKKRLVVDAVTNLQVEKDDERSLRINARRKLTWFDAIERGAPGSTTDQIRSLKAGWPEVDVGRHPEFLSYVESWTGPGDSPYSTAEILGWIESGELVQRLNRFVPSDNWDGPSLDGLTTVLRQCVTTHKELFVDRIDSFLEANSAYQYSVIEGLKAARSGAELQKDAEFWQDSWPKIISFCTSLVSDKAFWTKPDDSGEPSDPKGSWIPGAIADLLRTGFNDDDYPIPVVSKPHAVDLLNVLLASVPVQDGDPGDAIGHALNSSLGRCFEAFLCYALQSMRTAKVNEKAAVWAQLQTTFDREVSRCQNSHFDISALMGQYLAHLIYLSETWLSANLSRLFPHQLYPRSFVAAMSGFAYCNQGGEKLYKMLRSAGVLEAIVKHPSPPEHAREKAYQRIALALVWGTESFTSPILQWAMENEMIEDLAGMISFIARLGGDPLKQGVNSRVENVWRIFDGWASRKDSRNPVLAELHGLLKYLSSIPDDMQEIVLRAIAHADTAFETITITKELDRLFDHSPKPAAQAFQALMRQRQPTYDHEGLLRAFVTKISATYPIEALAIANDMRRINGMHDLLREMEKTARQKAT